MNNSRLILSTSLLGLVAGNAFSQATVTFFGSTSTTSSWIFTDVSADGRTAVGFSSSIGGHIWSESAGVVGLPVAPNGASSVFPAGISGDGTVVCGTLNGAASSPGFQWSAATGYTILSGLSGSASFELTSPTSCSEDGSVVGGRSSGLTTLDELTAWDLNVSTAPIAVPYLPGDDAGSFLDFADAGDVGVGYSAQSTFNFPNAFRWSPSGGTVGLGAPSGYADSVAGAISGDGELVFGYAQKAGFGDTALVRWSAAGLAEVLYEFPASDNRIFVTGASRDGSVAVGSYGGSSISSIRGFYWSEGTGFQDLKSYVSSRGAVLASGSTQALPVAISSDGNVIVGRVRSFVGQGNTRGFIARLAPLSPAMIGSDYCGPSVQNSIGVSPRLEAVGSATAADRDLYLQARGLPPRSFGFLIVGQAQGSLPNFGGGEGTQCLGSSFSLVNSRSLVRLAGIFQRSAVRLDPSAVPTSSGTVPLLAGQTWNFQFWYRDQGATGPTTNLTSARTIMFQ